MASVFDPPFCFQVHDKFQGSLNKPLFPHINKPRQLLASETEKSIEQKRAKVAKERECCGIFILGVPKTKNSATVFQSWEVHDGEHNAPWRSLSLRLFFRNIVAEFLCGVPAA